MSAQNQFNEAWWMQSRNDTLPSVNLLQIKTLLNSDINQSKKVIIAVLDSDVDINHKDLKPFLWKNKKETPNNGIDDDKNGYVDDIYGWNFLGKEDSEKSLEYTRMEETRILSKYSKEKLNRLFYRKKVPYNYHMVKSSYDTILKDLKEDLELYKNIHSGYSQVVDTLKSISKYKYITLDNIDNIKSDDVYINQCIAYAKDLLQQGYTYELIKSILDYKVNGIKVCMNLQYDNRVLVGDKPYDFCDANYGNSLNGKMASKIDHGTKVSGVIASVLHALDYKKSIEIMPLCITGIGDFLDKDLALAIRYAVDNGARIITLSQTKTFSLNDKKVKKAMKYAQKKGVLIIKSAGNENLNLDNTLRFPNDVSKRGNEVLKNLLIVGASGKTLETIKDEDSNYGMKNVDIFAPGIEINTLKPDNEYTEGSGSSYSAPIVSIIIGLIYSKYPNLTASEVKQIIMESGVSYNIMVNKPSSNKEKELVPFSSLSKSGKIVNAYNALLMAEEVSKKKKNKK
ncbi:S8 family peptidase [Kordia algicida OT-1]|uniref:Serine protease / subtilase peptidase n=1 Tax=Kordia algicida OT-1 TaxID=391587 RepID=A9DVC4_9FLAO|nr:S8 family peptidase [Kordia algicida]EDP96403.1 Serine protease / subtilase peptidase [Kordia algicida OT-1]